jgi:hypothetical protein
MFSVGCLFLGSFGFTRFAASCIHSFITIYNLHHCIENFFHEYCATHLTYSFGLFLLYHSGRNVTVPERRKRKGWRYINICVKMSIDKTMAWAWAGLFDGRRRTTIELL